jgi:hypothetical protein
LAAFDAHGGETPSWWGATVPTTGPTGTAGIWVANSMFFDVVGRVMGFRCYVDSSQDGNYLGMFWEQDANILRLAHRFRVRATTGSKWHQTWFKQPYRVSTTIRYWVAVLYPAGKKYQTTNALTLPVTHNHIAFQNGSTSTNIYPPNLILTTSANAQSVDVLFKPDP